MTTYIKQKLPEADPVFKENPLNRHPFLILLHSYSTNALNATTVQGYSISMLVHFQCTPPPPLKFFSLNVGKIYNWLGVGQLCIELL
jgi:hypothetical protein